MSDDIDIWNISAYHRGMMGPILGPRGEYCLYPPRPIAIFREHCRPYQKARELATARRCLAEMQLEMWAQTPPGIRQQRIDLSPVRCRIEFVDAFLGCQVGLHGFYRGAIPTQPTGGLLDLRFVRGDQNVVAVLDAFTRQLEPDAGGGAGYDGEGACFTDHGIVLHVLILLSCKTRQACRQFSLGATRV